MPNRSTKKLWPTFKEQWQEDTRGLALGIISLMSLPAFIAVTIPGIKILSAYLLSSLISCILIIGYYWSLIIFRNWLLKFDRISEDLTDWIISFVAIAIAIVGAFVIAGTSLGAVALSDIGVGAVPGIGVVSGAGAVAFSLAVTSAVLFVFAGAVCFAVGVTSPVVVIFASTIVVVVVFAGVIAVPIACAVALTFSLPLFRYLLLVQRSIKLYQSELESKRLNAQAQPSKSASNWRQQIKGSIQRLITDKNWLTLGLAGRRGIGKTVTVEMIRWWFKDRVQEKIRDKHQFKEKVVLMNARLKRVEIFIKSPTAFEEKGFLMSVFESLAREIDFRLSYILPPIKPIQEQRIIEKINSFRNRIHLIQIFLLSLVILWLTFWGLQKAGFWSSFKKQQSDATSLQQAAPIPSDSLLEQWYWPDKQFFDKEQKALKDTTENDLKIIMDRLASFDTVFSLKGKMSFEGFFDISKAEASLDSAISVLPTKIKEIRLKIDSLENDINLSLTKLDTVLLLFREYSRLQERIKRLQDILERRTESPNNWTIFGFLLPPLLILAAMLIILERTKPDRMNSSHYDKVRHELLLYYSTRDLLDRLHYNMTFSESESASMNIGISQQGFGLGFGRARKKKLTKAMQPFTLQSLVDEYKRYVLDVRKYISKALEESGFNEKKQESFSKILICIDELDKVLDPERLHDMLKSLKSIFELEGVYYILSISEDALESYELRGLQTKNEIDSTFTHVFKLPPMEVNQCQEFYKQKEIMDKLVPLAIVNGGGVPRDMERISDLIQLNSDQRMSPEDYRIYFENLEVKGLIEKIRNHPRLSPIQKKELEDGIHQIMESKVSIEQVADLIKEQRFLECYPCSAEESNKDYCNLLGLLQAFSVKAEINQLISEWMKSYDSLGKSSWWSKYKEGVDHLRQAVYLLGESPFAAKEESEKAKEIQS